MNALEVIGVVLAAVGVIITAVYYLISSAFKKGVNTQKLEDVHDRIKNYINQSVECEKRFIQLEERKTDNESITDIRVDVQLMKTDLGAMKVDLGTMKFDMDTIKNSIFGVQNQFAKAYSPIDLTDLGKAVASEMAIYDKIDVNWDTTVRLIEGKIASENPYDIQEACFELAKVSLDEILKPEDLEFLKTYAFNKGRPISSYSIVIGIVIRNKYFAHKDIDISEIDKHDPLKKVTG